MSEILENRFVEDLTVSLSNSSKELFRKFCNMTLAGVEGWPLNVPSKDIPQEVKDAHWRLNASSTRFSMEFEMKPDGNMIPRAILWNGEWMKINE